MVRVADRLFVCWKSDCPHPALVTTIQFLLHLAPVRIPPDAIIPDGKITRYLLVPKASGDKSKYLARGGFNQTSASALEAEIRRLAAEIEAVVERAGPHGVYYNVVGTLIGPSAQNCR